MVCPSPLVFSNGDFNPANFLSDGHTLTGFVDFGGACLEDPCFGVAKYATYDWLPFEGEAMMRHWVAKHGLSEYNYELRVALACLWTLRQLPLSPVTEKPYNQVRIRRRLREACAKLR
jgi:aminoglycoside phosphotransferase (APT) family kinase protein